MLTTTQIDHFRTFGFVVLPGFLGAPRTKRLRAEVDTAIRDAYAPTYEERVLDGISGHYLPMTSRLTPQSASLVCDDPLLIEAAEALLGAPVIPECPEGVLYFAEAGWHNDDGVGVAGVKFAVYFESLDAASGALRFLPGSQHPEQTTRLVAYRDRHLGPSPDVDHAGVPGYVADTKPADVIAFDLRTWHASFGGQDRLAWTAVYQRCPQTDTERDRTMGSMTDSFEQAFRGFDRGRYPVWGDWMADAGTHPRRGPVIGRMRAAGVFDLAGAEAGW